MFFSFNFRKLKDLIEKSTRKSSDGKIIVEINAEPEIFQLILESIYCFDVKPKPELILPFMDACHQFGLIKIGEYMKFGVCTPGFHCFRYFLANFF